MIIGRFNSSDSFHEFLKNQKRRIASDAPTICSESDYIDILSDRETRSNSRLGCDELKLLVHPYGADDKSSRILNDV